MEFRYKGTKNISDYQLFMRLSYPELGYIWNKTRKYVIVLEPQMRNGEAYYLLTAYYMNKEYGEKQMKKRLAAKLDTVV